MDLKALVDDQPKFNANPVREGVQSSQKRKKQDGPVGNISLCRECKLPEVALGSEGDFPRLHEMPVWCSTVQLILLSFRPILFMRKFPLMNLGYSSETPIRIDLAFRKGSNN